MSFSVPSGLHAVVEAGDTRTLELLLATADLATVNEHNGTDRATPLHLAVRRNDIAAISLLIRHGANLRAKDNAKRMPVDDMLSLFNARATFFTNVLDAIKQEGPKPDLLYHLRLVALFLESDETCEFMVEQVCTSEFQKVLRGLLVDPAATTATPPTPASSDDAASTPSRLHSAPVVSPRRTLPPPPVELATTVSPTTTTLPHVDFQAFGQGPGDHGLTTSSSVTATAPPPRPLTSYATFKASSSSPSVATSEVGVGSAHLPPDVLPRPTTSYASFKKGSTPAGGHSAVSTPSVATTHLPAVASIPATINIPMPITSPNPRDSRPPSLADAQHAVMIVLETLAFYDPTNAVWGKAPLQATMTSIFKLNDSGLFGRTLRIVHAIVLAADVEGDIVAKLAKPFNKILVQALVSWQAVLAAEETSGLPADNDELATILTLSARFSRFRSYQSDFYDPTVIDVMLRCCVQDALPLWTVAALCVLANIAESPDNQALIISNKALLNTLSVCMSSNEVLVAREATRLAVVLDIDFKTLGHPRSSGLFEFDIAQMTLLAAVGGATTAAAVASAMSTSITTPPGQSSLPLAATSSSLSPITPGVSQPLLPLAARRMPPPRTRAVPGDVGSSKSAIHGLTHISTGSISSTSSMSVASSSEDASGRSISIDSVLLFRKPSFVDLLGNTPKDISDVNSISVNDLRGMSLISIVKVLVKTEPLNEGFLNVIISTLTSICQPIIFLRLLVHAFRHNAEKYALRRSNSSHSDDSEGSRKERLSVADADEIVSVYSVDSINSAGTATAVPPSILQPTGLLQKIASGSARLLGSGRRSQEVRDMDKGPPLNSSEQRVVDILLKWTALAPEDFADPTVRRYILQFLVESIQYRPGHTILAEVHATISKLQHAPAGEGVESKFCNHNEVYVQACDVILSGRVPCHEDEAVFFGAVLFHLDTPQGCSARATGTVLQGAELKDAIKALVFSLPLVAQLHQQPPLEGNSPNQPRSTSDPNESGAGLEDSSRLRKVIEAHKTLLAARIADVYSRAVWKMTEKDAKHAFINKCRALRTFGFLFFNVKVIDPLVPVPKAAMLGIKSGKLVLVDPNMEAKPEIVATANLRKPKALDNILLLRHFRPITGDWTNIVLWSDNADYIVHVIRRAMGSSSKTSAFKLVKEEGDDKGTAPEEIKGFSLDLQQNRGCPPDPHISLVSLSTPLAGATSQQALLPRTLLPSELFAYPTEFARQLTLIEQGLYRAITRRAIFAYLFRQKGKDSGLSASVKAFIAHFNQVSDWVSTEVVREENDGKRVILLHRMILLAKTLFDMHNYNGVMEVVSGLNSSAVRKLQMTWKLVSKEDMQTFQQLDASMSPSSSYAEYRRIVSQSSLPCLPYLGIHLTDLTFAEDGNQDQVGVNGLVNLTKRRKLTEMLNEIMRFQRDEYLFVLLKSFNDCIKNIQPLDGDARYALALQIVENSTATTTSASSS